jgi:hypothetical protein
MGQEIMDREFRALTRRPGRDAKDTDEKVVTETQKYPGYNYNRAPHTTQIVQTRTQSREILILPCAASLGRSAIKSLRKLVSL